MGTVMKVVALLIALAGAAAHGPAFTDSDAVCSGVHTLNVGQVSGKRVTGQLADIESKVLGASHQLSWFDLSERYFACSDGRARTKQLFTPGGDFGEFVRATTVLSAKAGKSYSLQDVKDRLVAFLTENPTKRFAMCTDQQALTQVLEATGGQSADFDITKPPASFAGNKQVMDVLTQAKFQGDPTVVTMLKEPKEMFVSEEIVKNAIKAFYQTMWDKTNEVHKRMHLVVADGKHAEDYAVVANLPETCKKEGVGAAFYGATPQGPSAFIYSQGASDVLRGSLIDSFVKGDKAGLKSVVKDAAAAAMSRIAMQNFLTMAAKTRPGKPVYEAVWTTA